MPTQLFTSETAREYAKRSHGPDSARFKPKPAKAVTAIPAVIVEVPADDYCHRRKMRIRKQIARLDELMMECTDPNHCDRFASAISRLAELERVYDGRPMPGSLKPSQAKPSRARVIMPDPAQTPPPVAQPQPDPPST